MVRYVDVAVAYAEMLKDVGIRLQVTETPAGSYFSQICWPAGPMFVSSWFRCFPTEILMAKAFLT